MVIDRTWTAPKRQLSLIKLEVTICESSFMMLSENFLMPILTGSMR